MDFETPAGNEFDNANLQPSGDAPPVAAGRGPDRVLVANPQGQIVLPPGISLEDIQVEGRNIVVVADDGTRYVIIDGAIFVPQIIVDGVAVPPVNLAALLLGNEPQPAAGPQQSSGGNFAGPVGPLQAAYGLGDLLPYTELRFPQYQEREVLPDLVDQEPDIGIEVDSSGVAVINAQDSVSEKGLPARGNEPDAPHRHATDDERLHGPAHLRSRGRRRHASDLRQANRAGILARNGN